ncbi:ferredoxin [Amycolatopsis sp. NPDC004079]|uniref:ferredoxin n=1 Tax=Amycolatopsis sp. NPDC004079 TaxID=3154549 RepID=UPI0033A0CCB6
MAIRADNRLLDEPMRPVQCGTCEAWLKARKSSWHQTSIQWDTNASARCVERSACAEDLFRGCGALRESIDRAVADGGIPVAGE